MKTIMLVFGTRPENLLEFVTILQEELVRVGVLSNDYGFDSHKLLVPMQPGEVPVTYADITPPPWSRTTVSSSIQV